MCIQSCRTFLWGGEGYPTYDGDGICSCVCKDDDWSNLNIFGRASCVPRKAHDVFGWVGLAFSMAALCHVVYQLNQQVNQYS